jgi:hypothetical protein
MAKATELEYLKWSYQNADFGPVDSAVRDTLIDNFMTETNKKPPEGYNKEST